MKQLLEQLFGSNPSTSPKGKLDFTDFKKLLRTALFVGGASATTYILANIGTVHFTDSKEEDAFTSITIFVLTIMFEGINRFLKENTEPKIEENKETETKEKQ